MSLLTLKFWKSVWNWCKVNWKFLVGFAVPCIILYFFNQKKAQKILKKGIEFRKDQLKVVQRASDLESDGIKRNAVEFANRVEEVTSRHEEALRKLDDDDQARREGLGGADAADLTDALAERFDLDNGDKQ
ncbi:MAG: hypothetical protein CBB97_07045 [Candidatus Endolissoclinum sp. TMED37]|nr:MAG: hypothetical protein CBB97_07045 [Candidatus Endolissoclinum sp. TMED37]